MYVQQRPAHRPSPLSEWRVLGPQVRMAEDIDFKYPVKRACTSEITKLCKDVQHGHALVIRCLQDNMDSEDMSGECREEVTRDQVRSSQDYRHIPRCPIAYSVHIPRPAHVPLHVRGTSSSVI